MTFQRNLRTAILKDTISKTFTLFSALLSFYVIFYDGIFISKFSQFVRNCSEPPVVVVVIVVVSSICAFFAHRLW